MQQAARSYHKRFRSVRTQVHTFVHTDDDDGDDDEEEEVDDNDNENYGVYTLVH